MGNLLKAWIKLNLLTEDQSDYSATVSGMGSKNLNDIVNEIMKDGTENKRETIVSIVSRFQEKSMQMVLSGHSVNTGMLTNATDGSISRGWNIDLKGSYLRIAGEHPDCGIQFRNTNNGEIFKLPAQNIVLNEPSRLMLLIPMELEAGDYELTVTTQYTRGTSLLKSPRSATYHTPLVYS